MSVLKMGADGKPYWPATEDGRDKAVHELTPEERKAVAEYAARTLMESLTERGGFVEGIIDKILADAAENPREYRIRCFKPDDRLGVWLGNGGITRDVDDSFAFSKAEALKCAATLRKACADDDDGPLTLEIWAGEPGNLRPVEVIGATVN